MYLKKNICQVTNVRLSCCMKDRMSNILLCHVADLEDIEQQVSVLVLETTICAVSIALNFIYCTSYFYPYF